MILVLRHRLRIFVFCIPKSQEAARAQVIQPCLHNTTADPVSTSWTVPILLWLPKAIENLYIELVIHFTSNIYLFICLFIVIYVYVTLHTLVFLSEDFYSIRKSPCNFWPIPCKIFTGPHKLNIKSVSSETSNP